MVMYNSDPITLYFNRWGIVIISKLNKITIVLLFAV